MRSALAVFRTVTSLEQPYKIKPGKGKGQDPPSGLALSGHLSLSFPVMFPSRGRNPPYFSTFPLNRNVLKINIAERPGGPEASILSPQEPLSVLLCLLLTYLLNIFLKDLLPFSDPPPPP